MSGVLGAGLAALRRFYRPFALIQLAAVVLVVAYHQSAAVRAFCAALAAAKTAGGLPGAALSACIAGGILPEVARLVVDRRRYTLKGRAGELAFNLAFFAFNGVVIDLLYAGAARWFGTGADFGTVAKKVAFDQFIFTPPWQAIIITLFLWRHERFSPGRTVAALRIPGFLRSRVVPLLLPAWCFWIPMVSIIYALPVPLQFVLFVLALGAWSLILVFIANASAEAGAAAGDSRTVSGSAGAATVEGSTVENRAHDPQ